MIFADNAYRTMAQSWQAQFEHATEVTKHCCQHTLHEVPEIPVPRSLAFSRRRQLPPFGPELATGSVASCIRS